MIKLFGRGFAAVVAIGGLAASGVANASSTTCADALSNFSSCNGSASCEVQYTSQHPECFGGGATTSTTQINATVFTQAGAISHAISSRTRQSGPNAVASADTRSGLSAGGMQPWNVWASYGANKSRIRYTNTAATTTRTNSNVDNMVLGGDYALSPKMSLGLSVGFDRGNGSGQTGAGAPNNTGTDGYTIAPYLSYQIDKVWAVDASAGWGEGEFSSGAIKADADRWFATGNLSYNRWMGSWQYSGKFSYLHGEEKYGDSRNNGAVVARTASKNSVDQARLGVQAAYWMNGFMPYAGLVYASDVNRSTSAGGGVDPLGRSAWVWSLGVNFFSLSSKMTGGIAYEQENGRTNSKNEALMANINFRF
ncbi:MAG: autotransporter outer membrane beta-barrel domain-containing protein [Sulfuritalea sp.]|nr:autotransporter outer membrane beta-barrel domain-containing protein [Sulfuritalea sp.]